MLTQNILVGVRDPYGIRPLVIGRRLNSANQFDWILASESLVIENNDYERVINILLDKIHTKGGKLVTSGI